MINASTTENREGSSLRVNLELLDNLMNLAGELVLGRNQLLQAISVNDEKTLHLTSQRIDLVTSELQEGIMKTRMQPIANVFNTFPRIVRDVAMSRGKEVDLIIDGREVELDKTIIEAINDPFSHLVRNAVDHGIENPQARAASGKTEAGRICLKAFHEAGQVNIEISDDGRGMDPAKLAAVALEKNLISASQLDGMSDKDKLQLIFLPGFSTAEASGDEPVRGSGMDGVKTNIETLGGVIDISSEMGRGTTFRIKLPLTLAIIPSQIVSICGERYAIPQVNLDELLRIPAHQVKDRIEKVGDAAVIRLRGKLLPLLRVADVLGIQRHYTHPEDGKQYLDRREHVADRRSSSVDREDASKCRSATGDRIEMRSGEERRCHAADSLNIAVVSTGSLTYGLIVDQMHDSEEIVVKPLGRHLSECAGYAGATIMGDGRVALILDVYHLAKMGRLSLTGKQEQVSHTEEDTTQQAAKSGATTRWLCFRIADNEHFAIELEYVHRIERIHSNAIEHVGGKKVLQNRNRSLQLFSLDDVATIQPMPEKELVDVIMVRMGGREIGLLAAPPVDAVELDFEIDPTSVRQQFIRGTAIIGQHTTMIVDVEAVVNHIYSDEHHRNRAA